MIKESKSFIYKIDPFIKLLLFSFFAIASFFTYNYKFYLILLILILFILILNKINLKFLFKSLAISLPIIIISYLFNIKNPKLANIVILRLLCFIILAKIIMLTTDNKTLVSSLEKMLGFLKIFKIDPKNISKIFLMSLILIPKLLYKTKTILTNQLKKIKSKNRMNIKRKIKFYQIILNRFWVLIFRYINNLNIKEI